MRLALQFILLFVAASTLNAFSTTNIQYLYGNFDGNSMFDTSGGGKHTATVENFSTYGYGDFFGFADFTLADERFKYQDESYDIYFELSPRLSLSKTSSSDLSFLFVKDIFIAGQYNRQLHKFDDYEACLYGVGSDLNINGFDVFGLNAYRKEQNFGNHTYQLSANYTSNDMFNTNLTLDGFVDWTEYDLLTQNQLLYKLGYSPLKSTMYVGAEWHYYQVKNSDVKSNVLQAMIKISW